jgi:FdhE protein
VGFRAAAAQVIDWDSRIERAVELAAQHASARELLRFYASVARFQKGFDEHMPQPWLDELWFGRLLACVAAVAPPPLAAYASTVTSSEFVTRYWNGANDLSPEDRFLARAYLEPYAARLPKCQCARKPVVAVLRPQDLGARRSLVCSLCSAESDYERMKCPACGETNSDALSVYTTADYEHVRVDVCHTCNTYLKTIDLSKHGLAVPIVDEIATVALDVWAREQGYSKLEVNLLGL